MAEKVDIEGSAIKQIDGYVADVAYPSKVHFSFQAPWIDAVLALNGVVPPRGDDGIFTHVDLGCGDGVGLILAAASHPNAHFIGVDAMPEHIARGQSIIDHIGLSNVTLHCGCFADLMHLADGKADYVTAHGVLSWISDANRDCLLALASRWLAPGGAFCISYNCYPGWSEIAPFQALIRAMAMEKSGSSSQRFEASLDDLRTSSPIDAYILQWIDDLREGLSRDYFAHEYLNTHWRPSWSGDVVGALEALGLAFVGQTGNSQLRDDFCLKAQWLAMLANFPAITAREIARDIVSNAWFRRDVYLKVPGFGFEGHEQNDYRIKQWWVLNEAAAETSTFKSATPAGEIDFDNDAARIILEKLKQGPTCLNALTLDGKLGRADVLNTIDALWVGERIMPVDRPIEGDFVERTNSSLRDLGVTINGRATRFGVMPPQGEAQS